VPGLLAAIDLRMAVPIDIDEPPIAIARIPDP
jgi:hypothetical protein